ncbi:hypothetical protein C8J56DRAFT_967779 [Mycena floridula]|nr:hypothetical protein C8J56DRAFT_967779 [Mycena floridula]
MPKKDIVLVTGVSGFIASHLTAQLLMEGFAVRGTARGDKIVTLRAAAVTKNPDFQLVKVDDIAVDNLSDVLKDVQFIVHTASPLAGQATPEVGLKSAVQGTLNVLEQAVKAGIFRIVLTSDLGTIMDPSPSPMDKAVTLSEKDWGEVSETELLSGENDPLWNYLATKIIAEKAAWKFAEEHPVLDLTTVNPPFVYGPMHPDFLRLPRDRLGANTMIYALISGAAGRAAPPQLCPFFCDVRDVARAHVLALKAESTKPKRLLINAGAFTWKAAIQHLEKTRPELTDRLPSVRNVWSLPGTLCKTDLALTEEVLQLKEYIPWQKCLEDTIDSLLELEKKW